MNYFMKVFNKKLLGLILITSFYNYSYSQCNSNLLKNYSFEEEEFAVGAKIPRCPAEADKLKEWKDQKKQKIDLGSGCNSNPAYHSPDWFKNELITTSDNGGFLELQETYYTVINSLGQLQSHPQRVLAQEGNHFIGMLKGELIQQKLDKPLEQNSTYNISFFVRQFYELVQFIHLESFPFIQDHNRARFYNSSTKEWVTEYWDENTDNASIKLLLSNDRIKYINEESWDTDKKNSDEVLEITLVEFHPSTDGTLTWRNVSENFIPERNDFEWIGIEIHSNTQSYYIAIDNISLTKNCKIECSRTDDCFHPVVNGVINSNTPLTVTGLENATSCKIEILDILGQNVLASKPIVNCVNGIEGAIYFSDGPILAAATYLYRLTLNNSCNNEEIIEGTFVKTSNFTGTLPTDFQCNACGVVTPEPCCEAQPDIYLENITICGPGTLEYKAIKNIYIGNDVMIEDDATVIFKAGNEIIGDPYQDAEIGADITVEIEACPSLRKMNTSSYDENFISKSSELEKETKTQPVQLIETEKFQLTPNPNNGSYTVQVPYEERAGTTISVYNALGERVYQQQATQPNTTIDISRHPKGLYFTKIQQGENVVVKKVVYQ